MSRCLDPEDLVETLDDLPTTLHDTYARILKDVSSRYKERMVRLLQFLTYSERPLRVEEAVDVVSVNLSRQPRFDPDNRMPVPQEVARYCSSLVVLVKRKDETGRTIDVEIQLAHLSVKEYLLSDPPKPTLGTDLKEANARRAIVKVCLSYMLAIHEAILRKATTDNYPLAQYSARYWAEHALAVESSPDGVWTFEDEFFACPNAVEFAYRLYKPDEPWCRPNVPGQPVSALYYASFAGLVHAVRTIVEKGVTMEAHVGRYGNALQAASFIGHESIVRLFLEQDANVNMQGGYYGNALQAASEGGHENIAQRLLDKGAEVNARGGYYTTALQAASYRGSENAVKLLLDKKAHVNARGINYGTALHAASEAGHQTIVELLLERGADPNIQGGDYGTALQAASAGGHETIVQLLLASGAGRDTLDALSGGAKNQQTQGESTAEPKLFKTHAHSEPARAPAGAARHEPGFAGSSDLAATTMTSSKTGLRRSSP